MAEAEVQELKGQTPVDKKCVCSKCKKLMDATKQFYTYPDGSKFKMCKQCLTMHVDNSDPSTYLWILQEADVPYVPDEWQKLLEADFAKTHNMNSSAVLGKYLSKMKLKQWKGYRYADTKYLQEKIAREKAAAGAVNFGTEEDRAIRESQAAALKQQLDAGQISQAQYETLLPAEVLVKDEFAVSDEQAYSKNIKLFDEKLFFDESDLPDPAAELTEEDKIYLAMKWGRLYKPNEWVELERNYTEFLNSFDVQDADTLNTIILICKTYLKMTQAIDTGDLDGYQKLTRVYDSLRKSAKLTAAQNKESKADYVDSIGELVLMCEREEGFIPRWCIDIPQDKVDYTLKDMENYLYNLVTQDLGFGQQIETYIKKIELEKEAEKEMDIRDNDPSALAVKDGDIADFYEDIEEQVRQDSEITVDSNAYGIINEEGEEDEN